MTRGTSLTFGARVLKRVIDEAISLPISSRWEASSHFHVRGEGERIVVDGTAPVPSVDACGAAGAA